MKPSLVSCLYPVDRLSLPDTTQWILRHPFQLPRTLYKVTPVHCLCSPVSRRRSQLNLHCQNSSSQGLLATDRKLDISSGNAIKLLFLPDCVLWFQFQEIFIEIRNLIAVYFDADASWRLYGVKERGRSELVFY